MSSELSILEKLHQLEQCPTFQGTKYKQLLEELHVGFVWGGVVSRFYDSFEAGVEAEHKSVYCKNPEPVPGCRGVVSDGECNAVEEILSELCSQCSGGGSGFKFPATLRSIFGALGLRRDGEGSAPAPLSESPETRSAVVSEEEFREAWSVLNSVYWDSKDMDMDDSDKDKYVERLLTQLHLHREAP